MTISLDLGGLKSNLISSATNLTGLQSSLSKFNTGSIASTLPQISALSGGVSSTLSSLNKTISSIGTTITGTSSLALPSMTKSLSNLLPNTSSLSSLASSATSALSSSLGSIPAGLSSVVSQISAQASALSSMVSGAVSSITSGLLQAPSQISSVISEISGISNTESLYSSNLSTYIFDPDTANIPSLSDISEGIINEQLQTSASTTASSSGMVGSGVVPSMLYKSASIVREIGFRQQNKTALYQKAQLEFTQYSQEVTEEAGKQLNLLQGKTPLQNSGVVG